MGRLYDNRAEPVKRAAASGLRRSDREHNASMRFRYFGTFCLLLGLAVARPSAQEPAPARFNVDQILGFPSPDNLVASPAGSTIAWTVNQRGGRTIYVAEA